MRGFFDSPAPVPGAQHLPQDSPVPPQQDAPAFLPFGPDAFALAVRRGMPVFLIIGDLTPELCEPSLAAQIAGRTVPVHLFPGQRPDVELLCLRASALFSEESALPLCALLLPNGCPFLAAPLPPAGYPLEPSRLFVWLAHADRRFCQNRQAFVAQSTQVVHSLQAPPLRRPYSPQDAAHDAARALAAAEDKRYGGFGHIKAPFAPALRFLLHRSARGDSAAHASLSRALDAMLASPVYDPVDGGFFRAALTEDWRAFVPQKPLGVNALLALTLLENGRRSEAVRTLDFLLDAFAQEGGMLAPYVHAPRETYMFSAQQVCAILGSEEGLRACRLLGLLRSQAKRPPQVTPSRFSPLPDTPSPRAEGEEAPLTPVLAPGITPEDAAFLRRALPAMRRARAARRSQSAAPYALAEDCALAAWVLAVCGRRLGEPRYTQAAQRAVSALLRSCPPSEGRAPLPPGCLSPQEAHPRPMCGGACTLSLALLALGQSAGLESYAQSGLHLLSAALHAFTRPDGALLHTAQEPSAVFPRVPAIEDGELPAPAATLVLALRLADELHPQAHYRDAAQAIWAYAAPYVKKAPLAHAALVDAMVSSFPPSAGGRRDGA